MTQAVVLDGKAVASRVRAEVKGRTAEFARSRGRPAGLAVVKVGSDPAGIALQGRRATVVGASNIVGRPMAAAARGVDHAGARATEIKVRGDQYTGAPAMA